MTAEGDATRRRIMAIAAGDPGISLRSLAAKVNLSVGATWQHVQTLDVNGQMTQGRCPHCGRTTWVVEGEMADGRVC